MYIYYLEMDMYLVNYDMSSTLRLYVIMTREQTTITTSLSPPQYAFITNMYTGILYPIHNVYPSLISFYKHLHNCTYNVL